MQLYVPSHMRWSRDQVLQGPLTRLPPEFHQKTHMVVSAGQAAEYAPTLADLGLSWVNLVETPEQVRGIGPTRHWIGQHAQRVGDDKFVMMDDDIDFLIRRSPENWQLEAQTQEQSSRMFADMDLMLRDFASVGISAREGNNRSGVGDVFDENMVAIATRVMRMFGCRTEDWLRMEHGRVTVMEDFDLQLQLLRSLGAGGNCCLFYYANGQKQTNSPGGCSTYRDHATQDASARKLQELHGPELVRLRQKRNKTDAEGLGTRTEVTIYWKRAAGLR